eukprot:572890_1
MYTIFKLALYICLCRRLVESFADAFTYSSQFLFYYQIFLTVSTLLLTIAYALFVEPALDFERTHGSTPCAVTNIPDPLLICIVLFDFIACVINLVLFIKPLWKLSEQLKDQNQFVRNRFTKLIKKNALLATISTTTTLVHWIVGALTSGLWAFCQVMDIVVSATAIILLFRRNEKIFVRICCCCCKVWNKKLYEEQAVANRTPSSVDTTSKREFVTKDTITKHVLLKEAEWYVFPQRTYSMQCISE